MCFHLCCYLQHFEHVAFIFAVICNGLGIAIVILQVFTMCLKHLGEAAITFAVICNGLGISAMILLVFTAILLLFGEQAREAL